MLVVNLLEQKGDGVATVPSSASVATVVAELARHGVGALSGVARRSHHRGHRLRT